MRFDTVDKTGPDVGFGDRRASERLDLLDDEQLDRLDFGVIGFDVGGIVTAYNRTESERSGLGRGRGIGRDLFLDIAPCMNNALVAGRFLGHDDVDAELDYLFTFRLVRTPVRLRLLARPAARRRYVLVRPR